MSSRNRLFCDQRRWVAALMMLLPVQASHVQCRDDDKLTIAPEWNIGMGDQSCPSPHSDMRESSTEGRVEFMNSTTIDMTVACEDKHRFCEVWSQRGVCKQSKTFMQENCPYSCNLCLNRAMDGAREAWHTGLGEDIGVGQYLNVDDDDEDDINDDDNKVTKEQILWAIEETRRYLKGHEDELYGTDRCPNLHPMCAIWALTGECEDSAEYMADNCAPMCRACDDYIEDEEEEDFDCFEGLVDAWEAGDVERTFRRLTSEPFTSHYVVQILSSPDTTGGPWVITMDGAVSNEEAQALIDAGDELGYGPSLTRQKPRGAGGTMSAVRTSSTAWCDADCAEDSAVQAVMDRLSDFSRIPWTNSENLQLLRYDLGQLYVIHHDMIPDDVLAPHGPRVITAYIYLNDVPEGGGTRFDKLNITVTPKRGRVLLWPNVLDSDVRVADDRTRHEALPVERGLKYGANAWFHLSDWQTSRRNGCLGERLDYNLYRRNENAEGEENDDEDDEAEDNADGEDEIYYDNDNDEDDDDENDDDENEEEW